MGAGISGFAQEACVRHLKDIYIYIYIYTHIRFLLGDFKFHSGAGISSFTQGLLCSPALHFRFLRYIFFISSLLDAAAGPVVGRRAPGRGDAGLRPGRTSPLTHYCTSPSNDSNVPIVLPPPLLIPWS